jgi:hypothetical protein
VTDKKARQSKNWIASARDKAGESSLLSRHSHSIVNRLEELVVDA